MQDLAGEQVPENSAQVRQPFPNVAETSVWLKWIVTRVKSTIGFARPYSYRNKVLRCLYNLYFAGSHKFLQAVKNIDQNFAIRSRTVRAFRMSGIALDPTS